jgi:hypothetical protein
MTKQIQTVGGKLKDSIGAVLANHNLRQNEGLFLALCEVGANAIGLAQQEAVEQVITKIQDLGWIGTLQRQELEQELEALRG